jgi:hypothetical protein
MVHESSAAPSNGKMLEELLNDPRIKSVNIVNDTQKAFDIPRFVIENIWNEKFLIDYFPLSTGQLAAHASKLI